MAESEFIAKYHLEKVKLDEALCKRLKFKNCVRLRGLDKSNYLAEARGILIHSAGKVTKFSGEKEYIPLGTEIQVFQGGCGGLSGSFKGPWAERISLRQGTEAQHAYESHGIVRRH